MDFRGKYMNTQFAAIMLRTMPIMNSALEGARTLMRKKEGETRVNRGGSVGDDAVDVI